MDPAKQPVVAAESRSSRWLGPLIIGASAVGGLALLFTFSTSDRHTGRPLKVQPRDRTVLVSAEFLQEMAGSGALRTDHEHYEKIRFRGQRTELRYTYDDGTGVVIKSGVVVTANKEAATDVYASGIAALTQWALLFDDGVRVEDHDEEMQWGDHSKYTIAKRGDQIIGVRFIAIMGHRPFEFHLEGVSVLNVNFLHERFDSRLDALQNYIP